ncbi:MAG: hypothetical protein ABW252_09800 [Polyangiales bacterium]
MLPKLVLLCALVLPMRARAERVEVVSVTRSDGAPLEPALAESLRELLARLGVRLVLQPPASVSVQLVPAGDGVDVRVRRGDEPESARHVVSVPSAELFRETLAHVVVGAVEPLLEPSVDAPVQPPPRDRGRLRIGIESGPVLLARREVAARTGAAAAWVAPTRPRVAIGVGASVAPRLRLATRDVEARATVTGLRVRPALELLRRARFGLEVALPLGADLTVLRMRALPDRALAEERSVRVDPVLGAALGARMRLSSRLALALALGVDATPTPRRFVVRDFTGETSVLLALDRVRPYCALGFDFTAPPVREARVP